MHVNPTLIRLLADGQTYKRQELLAQLGCDDDHLAGMLAALTDAGLPLLTLPDHNYRLSEPQDLLDAGRLLAALAPQQRARLTGLEILDDTDSTNLHLLRRAAQGAPSGSACLAEQQQAGRGRQGRRWVSPFGCNIYLSLLWRFSPEADVAGLSPAIAVAVARALTQLGVTEIGLKWPNDVLWQNRKLAGILIDMATRATGERHAVIGIGLNVAMPAACGAAIAQPWTELRAISGSNISRNQIGGLLLQELLHALTEFEHSGLPVFIREWNERDSLRNKSVTLHSSSGAVSGTAQGIAADGALVLSHDGITHHYQDGETSLSRPVSSCLQTETSWHEQA